MADFKKKEALWLIDAHDNLIKRLVLTECVEKELSSRIKSTAEKIIEDKVIYLLEDIPTEEINRDRNGLRVKALVDAGYENFASLYKEDKDTLADIDGISTRGAYEIKRITVDIAEKARPALKIDLEGEKTEDILKIIRFLYAYKVSMPYVDSAVSLEGQYKGIIEDCKKAIEPCKRTFKWLFASRDKKESAERAYNTLLELYNGDYKRNVDLYTGKINEARNCSCETALLDYEANKEEYHDLFNTFCPDLLGKDDKVYGLPEDLATEVKDTPLITTGLNCTLRRYQEWGAKYILKQKRVLLGDEMGLGKTVQAIACMVSLFNEGKNKFMVICPASVLSNWCREIKKFSSLPVIKIHGDKREESFIKWVNDGGVAVTTYETTAFIRPGSDAVIDLLVVDEAHYIKNPSAQRTRNVKLISQNAENILFMTGTAMENKVDEMISLIDILNPGIAMKAKLMASLKNAPQFKETVAPVYYRRRREDVLKELPELIENEDWCELLPEEEKLYENSIEKRSFSDARRISWNVPDLKYSCKARRLLDIIEDAQEDGRKVIVFSFFLDTIRRVTELLGDRCMEPITGSVAPARRQEIVDEFTSAPDGAVLPAQIISGGTGLNIQCASVIVICEPQFKPSVENQAIGRAYRMGQKRTVLVHRLLCEDSVDERIVDILAKKQKDFDSYADESAAAMETLELDNETFSNIMEEEAQRISQKNEKAPSLSTENKAEVEKHEVTELLNKL